MEEKNYKYKGKEGDCQYNPKNTSGVTVSSFNYVTKENALAMQDALSEGPVVVAINADD